MFLFFGYLIPCPLRDGFQHFPNKAPVLISALANHYNRKEWKMSLYNFEMQPFEVSKA